MGCAAGCGTVFKLAPGGTETVLYAFKGGLDGVGPLSQLVLDTKGNLYGTTIGTRNQYGFGTIFRISPKGKEKILHTFCRNDGNCLNGEQPTSGLLLQDNVFYGTTSVGGYSGWGVVYKLRK